MYWYIAISGQIGEGDKLDGMLIEEVWVGWFQRIYMVVVVVNKIYRLLVWVWWYDLSRRCFNKIYRLLVWVWLHLPSFVWISLLGWQNRRPLLWRSTHWEMSTGRLISCRNPVGKSLVTAVFWPTFFEVRFDRLSVVRQFWFLERFTGPSPCARRFFTADKLRRRPWNQLLNSC